MLTLLQLFNLKARRKLRAEKQVHFVGIDAGSVGWYS
jgi:hypothetical protein